MGRRYLVGVFAFQYFMKLLLLLLLPLISYFPASKPAPVRVTFSPLTKAAYLAAKKACVSTKPQFIFPLKKQKGRIVIPTTKRLKVFKDVVIDETSVAQGRGEAESTIHHYLGYLTDFRCHLLKVDYYETSEYLLIDATGTQLTLSGEPLFAPDMRHIVATCMGIEYGGGQPNILQLLELRDGSVRQVWFLEPKIWEPYRICWTSVNTLLLSKTMWTAKSQGTAYTYAKLQIQQP